MADYRSINQPNMMVYDNLATNLGDIHQQRLDINYSEMMVRDIHTCIYIYNIHIHTHTHIQGYPDCFNADYPNFKVGSSANPKNKSNHGTVQWR